MQLIKRQRRSVRLKDYDYTRPGAYFVTICTRDRKCLFGEITDGKMIMNNIGKLVFEFWKNIPKHFLHVDLDKYVVMPNHLHGLLILLDNCRDTACRVPTLEHFGNPVFCSLPTVVRSFKSAVTKHVNILHNTPGKSFWHPRYYEHVVRNKKELTSIREYIITNPTRWAFDHENPCLYKHKK